MSNRIDFFQSSQTQAALPATSASIWIDGMLCPLLELVEIVRGDWPEFSWARLVYNPAAYVDSSLTAAEEIDAVVSADLDGGRVRVESDDHQATVPPEQKVT